MSTKTFKVATAKAPELTRLATECLGMTFKKGTPVPVMRAKIKAAFDGDEFTLEMPDADEAPSKPVLAVNNTDDHPSHVTVIVATQDTAGGNEPVPVSVNGKAMLIPRGEEATIPWAYYQVLKDAVEFRYDPLPDGGMSPARKVMRYPFNRVA